MALDDEYFYDVSDLTSMILYEADSAENGGLIEGSEFKLYFTSDLEPPAVFAATYTSDGVNVVRVAWTDRATSLISFLYYSLNLGINSDPAVDTSTTEFRYDLDGTYSVDYNSSEKDALLSQYKRYASVESTQITFNEALSNSISDIIEYTTDNAVTAGNLMNFKKSPSQPLKSAGLSNFSGGRTSGVTTERTTTVASSMTTSTVY